tara:strand:- start:966 stop:1355 length:390 start_codon:yes stop_codon:yes gene_type:complete
LSNKLDNEVQKAFLFAENVKHISATVKSAFFWGFCAFAVWQLFSTLQALIRENPDGANLFVSVIADFRLDFVVSVSWSVVATVLWRRERGLRQRCLNRVTDFRSRLEEEDPYKSSSGLDNKGQTPKGKD